MKYMVDIKFSGYFTTEVEANNEDEALAKVRDEWWGYSLGDKVDDVETWSTYIEDENGNVVYDN